MPHSQPQLSAITPAHLSQLACPACHGALSLVPSGIQCAACARVYPLIDGIPVLIAERAVSKG